MTDEREPRGYAAITAISREILEETAEPYEAARRAMGAASDALDVEESGGAVYCIWAALTDRCELEPELQPETEVWIAEAAQDWLDWPESQFTSRWNRRLGLPI